MRKLKKIGQIKLKKSKDIKKSREFMILSGLTKL